jgi:hypothetical protein
VVGKAAAGRRQQGVRDATMLGLADALAAFRDGSSAGVEGLVRRGLAVRLLQVASRVMTNHGSQGTALRGPDRGPA